MNSHAHLFLNIVKLSIYFWNFIIFKLEFKSKKKLNKLRNYKISTNLYIYIYIFYLKFRPLFPHSNKLYIFLFRIFLQTYYNKLLYLETKYSGTTGRNFTTLQFFLKGQANFSGSLMGKSRIDLSTFWQFMIPE